MGKAHAVNGTSIALACVTHIKFEFTASGTDVHVANPDTIHLDLLKLRHLKGKRHSFSFLAALNATP